MPANRLLDSDSIRNHPSAIEYAHWLAELGSEVRMAPSLPQRMFLVDRRIAMVPVTGTGTA